MTALDIINQARERLGDEKKQRWSDKRLLTIVSQGQQDICKWTNYLRMVTYIQLADGVNVYTLPSNCYRVSRVEYNDQLLPLFTRDDQDIPRHFSSEFIAFKSNLNYNKIEIYPAPTQREDGIVWIQGDLSDTSIVQGTLGVVTRISGADDYTLDPLEGEITDIESSATIDNVSDKFGEVFGSSLDIIEATGIDGFGVVVNVEHIRSSSGPYGFVTQARPNHIVSNYSGIIADATWAKNTFKVYYVAIPRKLQFIGEHLVIPELWEDLLVRYTVGTALQDDNDAGNIQRGELELNKYRQDMLKLRAESSKDFSGGAKDKLVTNYRRI